MSELNRISTALNDLIALAQKVRTTHRREEYGEGYVDHEMYQQLLTRGKAFAGRVFGQNSEYYKAMASESASSNYYISFQTFVAQLAAIRSDLDSGAIFELEKIVEADVFDEIIEQAEHLSKSGYKPAAAVICGCVLEETLRKLCIRAGITISSNSKLDWMNGELTKAGVYQKLTQKKITALADIRNSAAHGKWTDFSDSDVDNMIRDVRDFVTQHYQ